MLAILQPIFNISQEKKLILLKSYIKCLVLQKW